MSDNSAGDNDESSNSDIVVLPAAGTQHAPSLKQRSHQEVSRSAPCARTHVRRPNHGLILCLPPSQQQQYEQLANLIQEGKKKSSELAMTLKSMEQQMAKMQHQFTKATGEVNDTYQFCLSLLEEMKSESLKELDDQYNSRLIGLTLASSKIQESMDKMDRLDHFTDCFRKFNPTELLSFKQLVESRLRTYLNFDPELTKPPATDLEFVSNFQAIRVRLSFVLGVRCVRGVPCPCCLPVACSFIVSKGR